MPLLHCNKCHHEWENISEDSNCDWCGSMGYVLALRTDLEIFIAEIYEDFKAFMDEERKRH